MRIDRAVGQDQIQFHPAVLRCVSARKRGQVVQVILFGDGDIGLDRIQGRDFREVAGGRADQIADLGAGHAGDAVNRRSNAGKFEVQVGLLHGRLIHGHAGGGGLVGLHGVIQFLPADVVGQDQRGEPFDIQFGPDQLRLGHAELAVGLLRRASKGRGSIWNSTSPFRTKLPSLYSLRQQVAGNLGADLGVDKSIQAADPFLIDGERPGGSRS